MRSASASDARRWQDKVARPSHSDRLLLVLFPSKKKKDRLLLVLFPLNSSAPRSSAPRREESTCPCRLRNESILPLRAIGRHGSSFARMMGCPVPCARFNLIEP